MVEPLREDVEAGRRTVRGRLVVECGWETIGLLAGGAVLGGGGTDRVDGKRVVMEEGGQPVAL